MLNTLSNGAQPTRIDCLGHSLGGGVATLCGVWAALMWPAADVRVVTFGSPKVGNSDFAQSVLATVGRTYRVVNELDEVRALIPHSPVSPGQTCPNEQSFCCSGFGKHTS